MHPSTRRKLLIASGTLLGVAVIGILAGVLTKVALDKRQQRIASEQAVQDAAADRMQQSAGVVVQPGAAHSTEAGQADPKAAFYPEAQSLQESLFMVLGPDALSVAAQSGELPLAYAGWGPCRSLRSISNISLDLSAAATGCRGAQCAINLRTTIAVPGSCPEYPEPRQTAYLISGFSCSPPMYKTWADRLASWGYAVLQYDRPLGGLFTPASETESAYFTSILTWRNYANNTRGHALAGQFAAGPVAVIGHSMGGGLTAILSGMHQQGIGAAVMLDPVDFTSMSLRVARQFLAQVRQPVMIATAGVQCVDRNKCIPPQDHRPSAAEERAWAAQGLCTPNWFCCSWDDHKPGMESKSSVELTQPTDGPSGFVEFAAPGSWVARFGLAGHMSFTDKTGAAIGMSCPAVDNGDVVQPDALALATAFLAARLRGEPGAEEMALAWAEGKPAQYLQVDVKPSAAV